MLTSESKTRVPHILRAPSKLNPLLTHWRGDYALLPTLFVTMLGLRVLLGIIQPSIPEPQIHLWVIFSVVVFLWQVVGTSRASELFLKDTGNVPGVVVGYLSILTVAMFTVVQVADALASTNKPVVAQAEPGTGYVFVARAMARIIMERQLSTHVETRCYSACTVAFLAGKQRTMAEMAKLGFHKYKLESENGTVDVAEELDKDRQFFASRGISACFIQQIFVAEHSDLWVPEKSVLVAAGVVAGQSI